MKFYHSAEWKETRRLQLRRQPYCEACEKHGRKERGTEVDHIIPIKAGGERLMLRNLQTLCKPHHTAKTAAERTARERAQRRRDERRRTRGY